MEPRASVVIVHWNQPDSCVSTVERFLTEPLVADVIVVDNGSTAEALESLRSDLAAKRHLNGRWELIELSQNTGFGPGVNRGWEHWLVAPEAERTEFCAVCPHDALPDAGTVAALVDALAQNPNLGIVSADAGDGQLPFVDHVFGPIGQPVGSSVGLQPTDYAHGTLFMITRTCLETVGMFDERFFAYCEEADQGLRARAAGFDVGLVVGARVRNPHVNTRAPVVDYLMERNTILLVAEHFGRRKAVMRFGLTLWQFAAGLARPTRRGPYWSTRARALAIRDVLARRWGKPPPAVFDVT